VEVVRPRARGERSRRPRKSARWTNPSLTAAVAAYWNSPCDQQTARTHFSEIPIESRSVGKGSSYALSLSPTITLFTAILQPKNRLSIQVNYAGAALARQADHVFGSAGAITGFAIPQCDHSQMRRSSAQSLAEEP